MSKKIYFGIELDLVDKNSTGNYKVYRSNSFFLMFSYDSLIIVANVFGGVEAVTNEYNYSRTTGKHLSKFCDDYTNTTSKAVRDSQRIVSSNARANIVVNVLDRIRNNYMLPIGVSSEVKNND